MDQLRLVWRRNSGNIKDIVQGFSDASTSQNNDVIKSKQSEIQSENKSATADIENAQVLSENKITCDMEGKRSGVQESGSVNFLSDFSGSESDCEKLSNDGCGSTSSRESDIADFLGRVIGRAVTSVYNEHYNVNQAGQTYRHDVIGD